MEEKNSFTDFAVRVIRGLRQESRFSTAYIYRYALQAFTASIGGGTIFWGGVNRRSLHHFQTHLENRQMSYNTISTYIRALRALYNRGVDCGEVPGEYRLFANLKTGVSSEHKLALTAGQMSRLLDKDVSGKLVCDKSPDDKLPDDKFRCVKLPPVKLPPSIRRAQDGMRLMLLLQGMPYVDLAHLRKSDLKGDLLTCRRHKTGTELCVKLIPQARRLIARYRSTDESSPYLLDILTVTSSEQEAFDDYRNCLRRFNSALSRLPVLLGMKGVRVSSYTARHTWATLAKYCQVPEEVISEGLGHSSLEVTRTYLKSFEGEELSRANAIVNSYIDTGQKMLWNRG